MASLKLMCLCGSANAFRSAKVMIVGSSPHIGLNFSASRAYSQKTNNHYEVLGLPRTASKQQIRSAFLRLSKEYHPDTRPELKGKSEKFNQISEAYTVLSNKDKKLEYDYNLMRRENPSMPPADDIMAPFYRDGTIHPKSGKLIDTGFSNGQVVVIIVVLATVAGIAQYIRVCWVAAKRAARQEDVHQQAMADLERMRTTPSSNRQRLMARLVESRKAANEGDKSQASMGSETLVDRAPNG